MASIIKANQLQDFGGNSILTSDGAGNLTTQKTNYPAFRVTGGDQSLTNDTSTKLQFNTVDFDTDSAFDTTNYRFIVPSGKSGKYYFETYISIPGIDDGEFGQNWIRLNDTTNLNIIREHMSGPNQFYRQIISIILNLNVGDFVEAFGYQNSGGSQTATTGYFSGYRLGS
jgi:hypothetical protein